jgi:glycosyltransferase involved in cell wall biosynthesis
MRADQARRLVPRRVRRLLRRALDARAASAYSSSDLETDLTSDDLPPQRLDHTRVPELRGRPIGFGPVRELSSEPPVFLCGIPYDLFQGFAPAFGKRYGQRPAGFLIVPTWSIEHPDRVAALVEGHHWHTERFPEHRLRYLCNSEGEADLLRAHDLPADLLNHKCTVSDEIFRPLPDVEVEFDAVYVARFVREKRHELGAQVPRVLRVAYAEGQRSREREFRLLRKQILRPGHVLANDLDAGLPVRMSPDEVNRALNRAAVGLLLSEVEGASYAAVEYLLAGLPVVSTPSLGGREAYFDPEYCLICDPTPDDVRDAVRELTARQVPREYVRTKTLERLRVQRERILDERDALLVGLGAHPPVRDGWPYGDVSGIPWRTFNAHLAAFDSRQKQTLAAEVGLAAADLDGVQLTAHELRSVIEAVSSRPGCALLVFGTGHDSVLWERVNGGGTTAFVEADPVWADRARARLHVATVHRVDFTTRVEQWSELLDRPDSLALDLPDEVTGRR